MFTNLTNKFLAACHGRSTAFFAAFFVSGNIFHHFHRLDSTYITFMTALLGFVVGHSAKEDYFAQKNSGPNIP